MSKPGHLVHSEHRLQHINRTLLGSEVSKGVAILGGGGDQAGPVLQEELDEVGVVVLGGQVDWLLVQVVIRVNHCLQVPNFRKGDERTTQDNELKVTLKGIFVASYVQLKKLDTSCLLAGGTSQVHWSLLLDCHSI